MMMMMSVNECYVHLEFVNNLFLKNPMTQQSNNDLTRIQYTLVERQPSFCYDISQTFTWNHGSVFIDNVARKCMIDTSLIWPNGQRKDHSVQLCKLHGIELIY